MKSLTMKKFPCPGWLLGVSSSNWKFAGLIPSQGTYVGCGVYLGAKCVQSPVWVHTGGKNSVLLSHWCFSPSLPLSFLLSLKAMKKKSSGGELKNMSIHTHIHIHLCQLICRNCFHLDIPVSDNLVFIDETLLIGQSCYVFHLMIISSYYFWNHIQNYFEKKIEKAFEYKKP